MGKYVLEELGPELQAVIDKVQFLVEQGGDDATLMTAAEKEKLQDMGILYNTKEYWAEQVGFVPSPGIIIVYSNQTPFEKDEETHYIPGVKIGDGRTLLSKLSFIGGGDSEALEAHIEDTSVHISDNERNKWNDGIVTPEEREKWDSGVSLDVTGETLIFN